MKPRSMTLTMLLRRGAFARCVPLAVVYLLGAAAAAQQPADPGRGRGPQPVDPRVQIRMHHFAETNEDIPYALFVSSKVRKDKKAPMIVTLHGIGGTHTTMMRPNAIDLAEAGGYILLAPMGYNPRGWYGAPAPRGRRGAPPAPNQPPNDAAALEVIDLVRTEFKVDDHRTYLMGHSMGGAGTLYLAIKYPQRWAAAAALAPAAFTVDREGLGRIPKMPIMGESTVPFSLDGIREHYNSVR